MMKDLALEGNRLGRFGTRDLLWLMLVVGLAIGWYRDRVNNHYAYNSKQFTRVLDAKQRAERELEQCRVELGRQKEAE